MAFRRHLRGPLGWALIALTWTLHGLCFPFFYGLLEEQATITVVLPIVVTAALRGFRWGALAGVAAFSLNQLLLFAHGGVSQTLLLANLPGAVAGLVNGCVIGYFHDLRKKLAFYAYHDVLTGLYNRVAFTNHLGRVLERTPERDSACLLFIDLDGFKPINDKYGHAMGDALLERVAARLKEHVRGSDYVGRLGGDEFTVLLTATSPACALEVANRLLAVLRTPIIVEDKEVNIGASIGMASYPHHAQDAATLIRCADSAMYSAKRSGKNRALAFDEKAACSLEKRTQPGAPESSALQLTA